MAFRVFVSAVSKELGEARLDVARVLRRKGLEVRDQAHFAQGGGVLLDKLKDYIAGCDAVLCLVGDHTGVFPTPEHAATFGPDPTFERYATATGAARASTTQWEFLLAKTFGKATYVFIADPAFPRRSDKLAPAEPPSPGDLAPQERFRAWIKRTGEDRDTFSTLGKLIEDVLVLPFPDLSKPKPRSPRFATIGSLFKGREADMARLRAALGVGGAGRAVIASKPASLHALGGVGKTQLAIEFGLAHEDVFDALLFIIADSPSALEIGLASLTGVLRLPEAAAQEDDIKVRATLDWLAAHPGWYLVIDNVDDEATAKAVEARLAHLAHGALVVTGRLANWSKLFTPLHLEVLSPEASVNFLLERTDACENEAGDAAGLAQEVDYLALALEIAGGFIAARRVTFARYRELWRENRARVDAWYAGHPKGEHDYPRSVDTTWLTSFERLSLKGQELLERLGWLAPDPIPRFLFSNAEDDALEELIRYSLVNVFGKGSSSSGDVGMHRVLQLVVRSRQAEGFSTKGLESALRCLNVAFAGDPADVRLWLSLDLLAPHVTWVANFADQAGIAEPTARLMNEMGVYLRTKARWADAERFARRSLAIGEIFYGKDHLRVTTTLNNLAVLLLATNRAPEAEPLLCRALAIHQNSDEKNDPGLALVLNSLASLYRATNRLSEAEPLFRQALSLDETIYGTNHQKVARDINNLADLLQVTNRLSEAEPLCRRALTIDEAIYGENHPRIAVRLNNLAGVLLATNRILQAEPLFRRALAIQEACFGSNHPNVATGLNNLAELLRTINRLTEAEPLYRRAIAINEASYGKVHPTIAASLNNLARLLQATYRLAEAEPLYRRAIAINEASFNKDHPDLVPILNNLAGLLQANNRLAEAEPLYHRAIAIAEASYGKDHPDVANILNNLAELLRATNRVAEAEPLLRRALALREASYGEDHPDVAASLNNLAGLLRATNRLAEAEPLLRRAIAISEVSYGKYHPVVAPCINNLAGLLQATNRPAEAEPLFCRTVLILLMFAQKTGYQHSQHDLAIGNYCKLLSAMGLDVFAIESRLVTLYAEAGLAPPPAAQPAR